MTPNRSTETSATIVRLALIGGGHRGIYMAECMTRDASRAELVAVAEPREDRQGDCRRALSVPAEHYYRDHRELLGCLDTLKLDAVIIATGVATHHAITSACIEAGLSIFLEKPITRTLDEAADLVRMAERTGVLLQVGFNLRYSPFFGKLREIVTSRMLGTILSLEWTEAISLRHWTECYCRNPAYNNGAAVGSWLLEKSCHDMDQLNWILGSRCERVACFRSRSFFVPATAPDAPKRCTDGCPRLDDCPFAYVPEATGMSAWLTPAELDACVYHIKTDLPDRQVAIFEYEDGITVSFNLIPLVHKDSRWMTVYGTEATLRGSAEDRQISVHSVKTGEETLYRTPLEDDAHGGADTPTADAFLDFLNDPASVPRSGIREGFEAALMACSADLAAKERRVIELDALRPGK